MPGGFNLVEYLRQFTQSPKMVAQHLTDVFGDARAAGYLVRRTSFQAQYDIEGIADVLMEGDEFFTQEDVADLQAEYPMLRRYMEARGGRGQMAALAGMGEALDLRTSDEENVGFSFRGMDDVPSYEVLGAFDRSQWRRPFDYRPGAIQPQTPGEIEQYNKQRTEEILSSRRGRTFQSTPINSPYASGSEVSVSLPEAGQVLSAFSKKNAAGLSASPRGVSSGRFVKMSDFLPTEAENREILDELGQWLRSQFVKRYEALPIGEAGAKADGSGSGTLKRAVSEMTVEITRQRGEEHRIRLQLPDISRPGRHEGDPAVSVRYYGPRVFRGRVGLLSRESRPMRFQIRGEWLTTRSARPSRKDINVLEMTSDLRQQMTIEYVRLLRAKIKAREQGTASQPKAE